MRSVALYLALTTFCLCGSSAARSERTDTPRVHVIYPGQTLGMIAKRYNLSIEELCAANGIQRRSRIRPKQELIIPAPGEAEGKGTSAADATQRKADQARSVEKTAARSSDKLDSNGSRSRSDSAAKQSVTERDRYARRPAKKGYVTVSSSTGRFRGYAVGRNGRVTDQARRGMVKVMASWRTGERGAAVPDRLIQLLTKVSDHFGGRALRVVSGYRPYSPTQYTPHSRHNLGHAVDFSIPGVPNSAVRDYCLTLGSAGVGYYPNSTFVHLDVREQRTYWVDYSGPGEAPRYAHSRPDSRALVPISAGVSGLSQTAAEYPAPQPVDPNHFGSQRREFPSREKGGSQRTHRNPLQPAEIP
ncbi:MAG TPA: DUF882 domain-containing protein [Polyangiaceae bacterium]|nr:DUF882 domain-containing protein [Polyangiaceae bacterium]